MVSNTVRGNAELDAAMAEVSARLEEYMKPPANSGPVGRVLSYAASSRGKMLRPRLMLIAAQLGAEYKERADDLAHGAAVLEMIHMASLIHDDIIDDSALRRGRATVQARFGKDVAVYTGDFLLARVLRLSAAKEKLCKLQHQYADAVEHLCLGEMGQDLNRYNADLTVEQYLDHVRGKTAALFMIACGAGAEIAGCSPETVTVMEQIGEKLGMLFQVRDDLLDFTAGEDALGKSAGIDFIEGIYTLPVLYTMQDPAASQPMRRLMERNAAGKADGRLPGELAKLVEMAGALDKTRSLMRTYEGEIQNLVKQLPGAKVREMLLELTGELTCV